MAQAGHLGPEISHAGVLLPNRLRVRGRDDALLIFEVGNPLVQFSHLFPRLLALNLVVVHGLLHVLLEFLQQTMHLCMLSL